MIPVATVLSLLFMLFIIFSILGGSLAFGLLLTVLGGAAVWASMEKARQKDIMRKQGYIRSILFDSSRFELVEELLPLPLSYFTPLSIDKYLEYWSYELYTKRNERSIVGFVNDTGDVFCHWVVTGNPVGVWVNIRAIISLAKTVGASGMVDIHNHFSRKEYGPNLLPSDADIEFALTLYGWCRHNGLRLHGAYITSRGLVKEYLYEFFRDAEFIDVTRSDAIVTDKKSVIASTLRN